MHQFEGGPSPGAAALCLPAHSAAHSPKLIYSLQKWLFMRELTCLCLTFSVMQVCDMLVNYVGTVRFS
jgi:hypothetical protein